MTRKDVVFYHELKLKYSETLEFPTLMKQLSAQPHVNTSDKTRKDVKINKLITDQQCQRAFRVIFQLV